MKLAVSGAGRDKVIGNWGAGHSPGMTRGLGSGLVSRIESLMELLIGDPWNR